MILCFYVSGVCSTYTSFVLSYCVFEFHTLNKLETYVSLLLFYCFIYCRLVLTLSWFLMFTLDLLRYLLLAISVELLMYLHLQKLDGFKRLMSSCHLSTQSMPSSFAGFQLMINQTDFDVITLSETWLKNDKHLLEYV